MSDHPLDLDLVRAFVLVAELSSFTRAAEALGGTQAGVSVKLRKLEERLGRSLLERTPRLVRLTADGADFLPRARCLLAADREARQWDRAPPQRLRLGISDHTTGDTLPDLLRRVSAASPDIVFDVRMGLSRQLLDAYDSGELDAVVVRRESDRREAEVLRRDTYGWFATKDWQRMGRDVPLALLAAPCGLRALATRALDEAGIGWREAFTGGSVSSVGAAAAAGLAVAPLATHLAPAGVENVERMLGLPALPTAEVMLVARTSEPAARHAVRELAAFLKAGG